MRLVQARALLGHVRSPRGPFSHSGVIREPKGARMLLLDQEKAWQPSDFLPDSQTPTEEWFDEVRKELNISSMSHIDLSGSDYMSLWITYNQARGYLKISQLSYIQKSLRMFGLDNAKSAPVPMASGVKFVKAPPEERLRAQHVLDHPWVSDAR